MQVTEPKTMSIAKNLLPSSDDLPFQSEQGWEFSSYYMTSYLQEHADNGAGLDSEKVTMMAAGRLDWLLRETRPTLSGLFSEQDFIALLDCYQDVVFFPDQMNHIASDLCDHLGIELDDYEASGIAPLIEKLRGLSAVQRLTLVDAFEQTWHRGMAVEQKQPRDFLASIGIALM